MFGSDVLDLALGMALVFLAMSFLVSAIREMIESVVKSRAIFLERGIREILGGRKAETLIEAFYAHPQIFSLFPGEYSSIKPGEGRWQFLQRRWFGRGLPTYIPARNFAVAIMDLAMRGPVPNELAAMQTSPTLSVDSIRNNVARLDSPLLQRAVLTAADHAEGDVNKLRDNLQAWFDASMDRVSGWYKRRTHFWLFAIGLFLAATLNVNSYTVANELWHNKPLREAVARRAATLAQDSSLQRIVRDTGYRRADIERVRAELDNLNIPIGWTASALGKMPPLQHWNQLGGFAGYWSIALFGFLCTAFAVTLGAPFWFDALNKIMVIRSTVKPHEKSPEESSDDRQKGNGSSTAAKTTVEVKSGGGATASSAPSRITDVINAGAAQAKDDGEVRDQRNEWAMGEPDEGVL